MMLILIMSLPYGIEHPGVEARESDVSITSSADPDLSGTQTTL